MFKLLWCFIVGHKRTRLQYPRGEFLPLVQLNEPSLPVDGVYVPGLRLETDYCSRCGLLWGVIKTPLECGLVYETETVVGQAVNNEPKMEE